MVMAKVNKSAFVRNLLKDIGAISTTPPEDWRKRVEDALTKQHLKMHFTSIYQQRNKLLEAAGIPNPNVKNVKAKIAKVIKPKQEKLNHSVQDLISIQNFAKNFGGLDALHEAINIIKSFQV